MRFLTTGLAALLLAATAGCGDDDGSGASGTTETTDGTTSTTEAGGGTTTTSAGTAGPELVACESPEGFTISAPADWAVNEGTVLPPCSRFAPEPFEVPEGTDERVAAVAAYVDPVAFATASRPQEGRDEDRAVTAVDGRQAVRLSYEASGEALYPEGTPITSYLVDVTPQEGDPATLIVDTVGVGPFEDDHDANVTVLDRMAATLEITDPAVETDPAVVATYLGGGGGFSVTAESGEDGVCLRIPPEGEPVCTEPPAAGQVHTVALREVQRNVEAGVTGEDVWRVDLVTPSGDTHSYLPAAVPGTDVGAYAFHDTVEGFERLVLSDVTGAELRTVEPGEA